MLISRNAAAAGFSALIFATALAIPAAAESSSAEPAEVGGEFVWPISTGFLNQAVIKGQGRVLTGGGATWNQEALEFSFPVTSATRTGKTWTFALDGSAQVQGYKNAGGYDGWAVDVKYSDLKLKVEGENATLYGDYLLAGVANKTYKPVGAKGDDEPLVTFTLGSEITPPKPVAEHNRTTVSDTGMEKSLRHYPKGTLLKDSEVDLNVTFGATALSPGAIAGIAVGVLAVLGGLAYASTLAPVRAILAKWLPR
ncbi:HtaA domain-containing protein [uncultured Corynebacterium sp.]|uniref:HtaA domain-containing protein n=1 Tax=uncultured Corynebacterium sp. TaxID=159447 RepID=UPI00288A8098|nr:HtaA domain-containing protein [uncultured Corynebacterium sp.]